MGESLYNDTSEGVSPDYDKVLLDLIFMVFSLGGVVNFNFLSQLVDKATPRNFSSQFSFQVILASELFCYTQAVLIMVFNFCVDVTAYPF